MSKQFLLALRFTQIGNIPIDDGGYCGWFRRKLSQCHHNSFFPFLPSLAIFAIFAQVESHSNSQFCLAVKRRRIHKRFRILTL